MLKAAIAGLVLSLSTAAFATPSAPAYGADHSHLSDQTRYGTFKRRPPIAQWKTLASSERVSGRELIRVRGGAAYGKLKLEAARGTTFVDKVLVTFGNGTTQLIDLDKRLSAGSPLVIDLDGRMRMISKIEVFGRGTWRSAINVLAV